MTTVLSSDPRVAPDGLLARARALLDAGFRVALAAGHDDRAELHVDLDPAHPRVPSLAGISFSAGRFERQMRDLFGIVPVDHPLPRRLVRHFHWPRGWYPMLADAGAPPAFGAVDGPTRSAPSRGPACSRSPSVRSTPA